MKLLFDQNLSPDLVKRLADLYPGSAHVYHIGIDRVADKELRDYARREGFAIVTPPKVIWIRRGNCSTAAIEAILRAHNQDIDALDKDDVAGILTLF
ncbi:MAG TPA: DUF5615 family PIN-like protein [Pyrinomonadaceae bacterium]|nr:DUF5615 family PIN-like protein [Pyrinomonadaceae bacterium]